MVSKLPGEVGFDKGVSYDKQILQKDHHTGLGYQQQNFCTHINFDTLPVAGS